MKVVVDASVAVKWVLPDPHVELDADQALVLLTGVKSGDFTPLQPPHWLAEVAAVITRLHPEAARRAIELLYALELPVTAELEIFVRASSIAERLGRHVFDTLYHAVALEHGATLITADDEYYRKARPLGHIIRLWTLSTVIAEDDRKEKQD